MEQRTKTKRRLIRMKIRTGMAVLRSLQQIPRANSLPLKNQRPSSRCRLVSVNRATATSIVRRGACAGAGAGESVVTVVVTATASAAASGHPRLAKCDLRNRKPT